MANFLSDKLGLIFRKKAKAKFFCNLFAAYASRALNLPSASRYPFRINIEPTNLCNLRCPMCPTGSGRLERKSGIMSFELYKKILDEAGDYLFSVILFGYGEPFLNPDIVKMIRYTAGKNIWVWTSTNGQFFRDEKFCEEIVTSGLHYMLICVDGLSDETISAFRKGADFGLLIEGIKRVVGIKRRLGLKRPYLELQFIKMKHNQHETDKVKALAEGLGMDRFSVKNVGISVNYPDFTELAGKYLPEPLDRTGYFKKNADGTFSYAFEPRTSCKWLYASPFINWDGTVTPCCYDLFGGCVLGDVSHEPLAKIWNNDAYKKLRLVTKKARDSVTICRACPEGRRKLYSEVVSFRKS